MMRMTNNDIYLNGELQIKGALNAYAIEAAQNGGAFLSFKADKAREENIYVLGEIASLERFNCCYRECAFFMSAQTGDDLKALKGETLCLIVRKQSGRYLLMLPVFDSKSSAFLQYGDNGLELVANTGSAEILTDSACVLYIAEGEDPYALINNAALDLKQKLASFKLRTEKAVPDMLKKLGWCTWNAFYFDVNEKDLLKGLKDFYDNGVKLGYALIDDGWLSTNDSLPIGSRVLTSFEEDKKKFPSGFKEMSKKVKEEFGVDKILVWHAVMGYWGGCDVKDFGIKDDVYIKYSSALQKSGDDMNKSFAHHPVKAEKAYDFYNGFHTYLKQNGISGVKIDTQYVVEGTANANGGRVKAMEAFHKGLEKSVRENFNDNCLNCMSCSIDMLYRMEHTNMLRASFDYSPEHDNTAAITANCAYNSFWMYPFAFSDWDMFWSNNDSAFLAAVSKIAGGSPVYVSDKPDDHDYELLKALYVNDGEILRAEEPGRPTIDCLMSNPISDKRLLKVFNKNKVNYIIGAMNLSGEALNGEISPKDIYNAPECDYLVFGFKDSAVSKLSYNDTRKISLGVKNADIYTFAPVVNGVAALGMRNKLNSGAAVEKISVNDGVIIAEVSSSGKYELWCETEIVGIIVNGMETAFTVNGNILKFEI